MLLKYVVANWEHRNIDNRYTLRCVYRNIISNRNRVLCLCTMLRVVGLYFKNGKKKKKQLVGHLSSKKLSRSIFLICLLKLFKLHCVVHFLVICVINKALDI